MDQLSRRLMNFWNDIALEYYEDTHETSRNFDRIIQGNLQKIIPELNSNGLYLDLGGGKGRIKELFGNCKADIIVGDISTAMIKTNKRSFRSTSCVQMDAFEIPFRKGSFDGVFSLLGDPYALPKTFEEVLRILKAHGFFFLAVPSKEWAESLRSLLDLNINETIFRTRDNRLIKTPSFVYASDELEKSLRAVGFKQVHTGNWRPMKLIPKARLSRDVLIVAKNLKVPCEKLSLITYAIANKGDLNE